MTEQSMTERHDSTCAPLPMTRDYGDGEGVGRTRSGSYGPAAEMAARARDAEQARAAAAPANGPVSPLPISSAARKEIPLWTGALAYAPAALALMAATSQKGNAKHNPGEPLHHARGKSIDHQDCIARHMVDFDAMVAYRQRYGEDSVPLTALEEELGNLMWRTAMFVQEAAERLGIAPRAPRAVLPAETAAEVLR